MDEFVCEETEEDFNEVVKELEDQGFKKIGARCFVSGNITKCGTPAYCITMYKPHVPQQPTGEE